MNEGEREIRSQKWSYCLFLFIFLIIPCGFSILYAVVRFSKIMELKWAIAITALLCIAFVLYGKIMTHKIPKED